MTSIPPATPEPGPDPGPDLGPPSRPEPQLWAAASDSAFGLDERAALALCLVDPSPFDTGTVVELLVRVDAEQSRWAAARVRLLADLSARDTSQDSWAAEEVGAALRLSPARAMTELKNASQLHDGMRRMFDQLAAGAVTAGQARLAVEASYGLPDQDAVAALDEAAAERCGELSEPQTRRFLRRQVLRADPAGAQRRHAQAVADRYVRLTEADDGMALLTAFLPAPEAVACMQRLDAAAREHRQANRSTAGAPRDPRTLDQLRADLFTHALLTSNRPTASANDASVDASQASTIAGSMDCAADAAGMGLGASVQVIVSASTLLGQDDEPGWLDRYGPITADTARRIAHDPTGTWRRLVTDPATGQLTDVGTRRYRPPPAIRRHVELRDGTCRFPYCTLPAAGCDLDHAIPYPEGPTSVGNLQAVSRRHHRAKTHTGWRVTFDPDTGEATWTSPLGRTRTTRPSQRWPLPDDPPF